MLISAQFNTIAKAGVENQDAVDNKSKGTKDLPAGANAPTANRSKNNLPNRQHEFPKLLTDEERLEGVKIDRIKQQIDGKLQIGPTRDVKTSEVISFFLFTFLLLICIFQQLNLEKQFQQNNAIESWIADASFLNGIRGEVSLDDVKYPQEYYQWLHSLMSTAFYNTQNHDGQEAPPYRQHALPEHNILISPIRLTQRKISLIDNGDEITRILNLKGQQSESLGTNEGSTKLGAKKWCSVSVAIDPYAPFNEQIEFKGQAADSDDEYQIEGSFLDHGGYVRTLDVYSLTKEEAQEEIDNMRDNGFFDLQTKVLTTDMMFYNAYSDMYTTVMIHTNFKVNGFIESTDIEFMNIQGTYYSTDTETVLRMVCEFVYMVILIVNILIEISQISHQVYKKFEERKNQMESEAQRKERAKKRAERQAHDRLVAKLREGDHKDGTDGDDDEEDDRDIVDRIHLGGGDEQAKETQDTKALKKICIFLDEYVLGILKFVPMGLKAHFRDFWNLFDVTIVIIAATAVEDWLEFVFLHLSTLGVHFELEDENSIYQTLLFDELDKLGPGARDQIRANAASLARASQGTNMYRMGLILEAYKHLNGILILLLIIKCLSYIEKFNQRIGMVFQVISVAKNDFINFFIIFGLNYLCLVIMFKQVFGSNFHKLRSIGVGAMTLWRYLLNEKDVIAEVEAHNPVMFNVLTVFFICLVQFVFININRAFVSHAYVEVSKNSKVALTQDEELALKHWTIRFKEFKEPIIKEFKTWWGKLFADSEKKKNQKQQEAMDQAESKGVTSVLNRKKNAQDCERKKWRLLKDVVKGRISLEKDVLNSRKLQKNMQRKVARMVKDKQNQLSQGVSQGVQQELGDVESDTESVDEKLDAARVDHGLTLMRRVSRTASDQVPEQRNHRKSSDDASKKFEGNIEIAQINLQQGEIMPKETMKELISGDKDKQSSSKQDHVNVAGADEGKDEEDEGKKAEVEALIKSQEDEKHKFVLGRMDWDKNFTPEEYSSMDDSKATVNKAFRSEAELARDGREQLQKCGRLLWESILFGIYLGLGVVVIGSQIQSDTLYQINSEVDNYIRGLRLVGRLSERPDPDWMDCVFEPCEEEEEEGAASTADDEVDDDDNDGFDDSGGSQDMENMDDYDTEAAEPAEPLDTLETLDSTEPIDESEDNVEEQSLQEDEGGHDDAARSLVEEGSSISKYVTLESIKDLDELIDFMKYMLPQLGEQRDISSAYDQQRSDNTTMDFKGFFLSERKYFVGDMVRLKFQYARKNEIFKTIQGALIDKFNTSGDLEYDDTGDEILWTGVGTDGVTEEPSYTNDDSGDQEDEHGDVRIGFENKWYKELLSIPANIDYDSTNEAAENITKCEPIVGPASRYPYYCTEDSNDYYTVYFNITQDADSAQIAQSRSDALRPYDFTLLSYNDSLHRLIDDNFFNKQLKEMNIDFVTFESFYDIHALTNIKISFNYFGLIQTSLQTQSMRLDSFQNMDDWFDLGFFAVFVSLFVYIVVAFVSNMRARRDAYEKWRKFEIEQLTEVETKQREKKKPEALRQLEVMFDGFTIINFLYILMTAWQIVYFMRFALDRRTIVRTYPIWPDLNADFQDRADDLRQEDIQEFMREFEQLIADYDSLKTITCFSALFVCLKFFEYFYKSKSMRALIKVLSSIQLELINILTIFLCILVGYVCMAHMVFGSQVYEFSSPSRSTMNVFQLSLPDGFNLDFLDKTTSLSVVMTTVFFFPSTIAFKFVFANIFLAMMVKSYEENIAQYKRQNARQGSEDSEEVSLVQSFCYCTIPNTGTDDQSSRKSKKKGKNDFDGRLILGINQEAPVQKRPEYLDHGFDPYDPDIDYNTVHYLQGFDNLELNMQISQVPIQFWCTATAKEIYEELENRTKLRKHVAELQDKKFAELQGHRAAHEGPFDDCEFQQRRIEYWNYIRRLVHLLNLQNTVMKSIMGFKERQIETITATHKHKLSETDKRYLEVHAREAPIEKQLRVNMDLHAIIGCLDHEADILKEKVDQQVYLGYNDGNGIGEQGLKKPQETSREESSDSSGGAEENNASDEDRDKMDWNQGEQMKFGEDRGRPGTDQHHSSYQIEGGDPSLTKVATYPQMLNQTDGAGPGESRSIRQTYFDGQDAQTRQSMRAGFVPNQQKQLRDHSPAGYSKVDDYMGEFDRPVGNDVIQIEEELRESQKIQPRPQQALIQKSKPRQRKATGEERPEDGLNNQHNNRPRNAVRPQERISDGGRSSSSSSLQSDQDFDFKDY